MTQCCAMYEHTSDPHSAYISLELKNILREQHQGDLDLVDDKRAWVWPSEFSFNSCSAKREISKTLQFLKTHKCAVRLMDSQCEAFMDCVSHLEKAYSTYCSSESYFTSSLGMQENTILSASVVLYNTFFNTHPQNNWRGKSKRHAVVITSLVSYKEKGFGIHWPK